MGDREGLILQGCSGEPQEWVDGINKLLTEAGILLDGSTFKAEEVSVFQHGELTNMLFPFEGVKLDMGRLAMWRIQTHDQFGGTWLSDYVPNRLGGFEKEQEPQKPRMELLGHDGNIFGILGRASRLLKRAGQGEQADEMYSRVTSCGDYYQALNIISEYVETELSTAPKLQKSQASLKQTVPSPGTLLFCSCSFDYSLTSFTQNFLPGLNAGIARDEDARRGLYLLDQVYELMYQIAKK